ncbi:aminodeoxychorismate lyase [Vibrio sp. SM6]|uniref:Aminodeoxychorismate lyase n=1 Tax=Vibrio agarilyticus TaxID=2726741 RepID=A0A7X8TN07_9VIBR|nr:aminodeoxychorismate lyase [Vibrio agarilyticus]NLS11506.1 aminodeoxychorismate lyase [Vibrio agarilyticus]
MYWVNGVPSTSVTLNDRSFQYGDGCFTTMRVRGAQIEHWPYHKARMAAALECLKIAEPDWVTIESWLAVVLETMAQETHAIGGIKWHVSRGQGGRGYSPANVDTPCHTMSSFAYPSHYATWQQDGIALGVCQTPLSVNPYFAGHKHNNRLEQVLCKAELEQGPFADGITINVQNHVIETTMANLFWRVDDKVFTPALTSSGVAGVMRRCVMDALVALGQPMVEVYAPLSQLLCSDEVWLCNSLLGVAPVSRIGEKAYPIGKLTRTLQGILNP